MGPEIQIIAFTVVVALVATALIIPPGIAMAWLLARRNWKGKTLVETLVTLPLVMPPVATGLLLLRLLGRRGFFGRFLHAWLNVDVVFTWKAVVAAMAVMSFPLLVRTARVAFEEVNRRFEHVASSLGAGPSRVFHTITLPLARRGIAAGVLLAFARALGEFGATILVAGNIPGRTSTISLSIYHAIQLGRDADAFRLLAVSVVLAFCAVWTGEHYLRKGNAA